MWFRKRRDDDFQAEVHSHMRLEVDRLIADGMSPMEAEATARRTFGNVTVVQERFYESQRSMWLDQLRQDLHFGFRSLLKARGFTAAATLTIALGVGANTAVFSLIDAVLLKTLPVQEPRQLLFLEMAGSAGTSGPPHYPCFSRLRTETRSFTALAAFSSDELRLEIDGHPEQVMGQVASGNYFELLGVKPLLGRVMTPNDERLDPPVAVISERYWRKRFGADQAAIGKSVSFRKQSFVIVGVTPAEFQGLQPGSPVDITVPITTEGALLADSGAIWMHGIVGRLKPGISSTQAQAEADVVFRSFMGTSRFPQDIIAKHFHHLEALPADRGMDVLRRRFSQPLYALMSVAGLVLLLATANIANLLLSRGINRGHEFSIRLAAGASRARIIRQLLTETLLLFCLGALPGVLFANWGVGLIEALFREGRRPVQVEASLNWRVLLFSLVVTLAAGLIAGLVSAWRAFRADLGGAMKDGQARTGESRATGALTQALVTFQVALSFVLLVGALLFTQTLSSLRSVDRGFRGEDVLTMSIQSPDGYSDAGKAAALWARVLEDVRRVPGVKRAAISAYTPLSGRDSGAMVRVRGYVPSTSEDATVHTNQVSEGYFEALGIPLVRGRLLTESDTGETNRVALVNTSAARKFFGERDPIGESLEFTRKGGATSYRIVGVVGDTKHMNLRDPAPRFAFIPIRQPRDSDRRVTLVLASNSPGEDRALPDVQKAVAAIDTGLFISDVITIRSQIDSTLLTERLLSGLASAFGLLAMTLGMVGLYGVLSYRVGRQRRSIGIRMALGASPSSVAMAILRQSAIVIALGVLAGLPLAIVAARIADSMLFGVTANEPLTYFKCVGLLGLVGLVSAYLPARRAAAVEPVEA
ncbi:MAG TPA: ABC transporter permease, partial [Bryobacteraceae bacterium]|nr:ABC transporter permease [Bryobacteraceae bacterium]